MAKGILKKVAQRLITSHYRKYPKSRLNSSLSSTGQQGFPDQSGFQTAAVSTNQSLWMKPSELNLLKDPVVIDELKDAEDIEKELLSDNIDSQLPRVNLKIDTHALIKALMESGFTMQQAEALTMSMVQIVGGNSDTLQSSMVSKSQAQLTIQKFASQLAILRRDMMIMEKTDFTELVTKIERITSELEQLRRTTKDEITKISSDLTLDFNLEKGKVKDMHLDHLRAVEDKHAKIFEKINNIEKELQNVRSYINTENASLQTLFERYKSDSVKVAFGAIATCMTIVLGFYRIWS
ncbi:mitochondrial calcium uniporter regulator 1-like [Styela clava]|uniref:mitochondrial calcium uniporter regulator 1-like n=1 Tax=Styela clava TaxID=7725 RepID=UPI00193ADB03|nr:mitochondrial calcium uniporter regulator 1-like [Styela clava]